MSGTGRAGCFFVHLVNSFWIRIEGLSAVSTLRVDFTVAKP
jgi:hypothetical protein